MDEEIKSLKKKLEDFDKIAANHDKQAETLSNLFDAGIIDVDGNLIAKDSEHDIMS